MAIRRWAWASRASKRWVLSAIMARAARARDGRPQGRGRPQSTKRCGGRQRAWPLAPLPRNEVAHGGNQVGLGYGELGRAALPPFLGLLDVGRGLRAGHQILDLNLAPGTLIPTLDDDAGRAALVGVLHLRLDAGAA